MLRQIMYSAEKFERFLESVNLHAYREQYRPIKIVEMDLPKEIQAIVLLYKVYWDEKRFLEYEVFYKEYSRVPSFRAEERRRLDECYCEL